MVSKTAVLFCFKKNEKELTAYIVKFALVAISFSIRATDRSKDGRTDRTTALAFVGHSDFYFTLAARLVFGSALPKSSFL